MSTTAIEITNDTPTLDRFKGLIGDETFLRINAEYKFCKVLIKQKQILFKAAHRLYAYGLTASDFDAIVRKLADLGFCSISTGERGGVVITLNESGSNLSRAIGEPPVLRLDDIKDLTNTSTE